MKINKKVNQSIKNFKEKIKNNHKSIQNTFIEEIELILTRFWLKEIQIVFFFFFLKGIVVENRKIAENRESKIKMNNFQQFFSKSLGCNTTRLRLNWIGDAKAICKQKTPKNLKKKDGCSRATFIMINSRNEYILRSRISLKCMILFICYLFILCFHFFKNCSFLYFLGIGQANKHKTLVWLKLNHLDPS